MKIKGNNGNKVFKNKQVQGFLFVLPFVYNHRRVPPPQGNGCGS